MKNIRLAAAVALAVAFSGASAQGWGDESEDEDEYYEEDYYYEPAKPKVISLQVCNKSGRKATVAVSYIPVGETTFLNRGWFEVENGACNLIADTDNGNFYFYGDATDGSDLSWSGGHSLCVQYPGPYTFYSTGSSTCASGQVTRNFVPMHHLEPGTYTWTLDP